MTIPTPPTALGNQTLRRLLAARAIQAKLRVSQPNDPYEQEADRVADQVMRMPAGRAAKEPCSACASSAKPCLTCAAKRGRIVQRRIRGGSDATAGSVSQGVGSALGPGHPLDPGARAFFEPRFGRDFGGVRVQADARANRAAQTIDARAFTLGPDIAFATGEYRPDTFGGRHLLAHELAHVVQQSAPGSLRGHGIIQRQPSRRRAAAPRLELRPSINGGPCACLVFIHNDERNARAAAEGLHQSCRYNLAIVQAGRSRGIQVPGTGEVDPNELFPESIQEECTRDEPACSAYAQSHSDLRAVQIQFFLAIRECSSGFTLPTVALHNNAITDTAAFLGGTSAADRGALRGDIERGTASGAGSREDLRARLGRRRRGMMTRGGTTNIFRWCNLPEIGRCHIGDPDHPDHVIWVTTAADFATLRGEDVNVVLQEGSAAGAGSESETDLSTLFLRQGATVRFINIETPITPETRDARDRNEAFIRQVLASLGLSCCESSVALEPMLKLLPFRGATNLLECVRIMGEGNAAFCRRVIIREMRGGGGRGFSDWMTE